LITVALVTTIFFVTGITGGVGEIYLQFVQTAFGSGALVIPLVLGLLGLAILIQEQFQESRLTSSHLLGILIVLATLLALLEFPLHEISPDERFGKGGGLAGYYLVQAFDATIGRPAATLVVMMLLLAGLLLTFNVTLREIVPTLLSGIAALWDMLWSAPRSRSSDRRERADRGVGSYTELLPPPPLLLDEAHNADERDEIVPTPIAERPTRASLYRRSRSEEAQEAESAGPPAPHPAAPPPTNAISPTPPKPPAATSEQLAKQEEKPEVQQSLDGFDSPAVHLAWPLPSLDLLDHPIAGGITDSERQNRARLIEETLASFKVEAQIIGVHTGPVITQFELQPAVGVKISKITTLEKDLALALAAPSIRIEAPIPGKSAVGIEIPNSAISVVTLREVIDSPQNNNHKGKLKLPMGKDISGTPVVSDLTRMPHLLVAGSTGSGKSVAINAFLCGLLLKHTPEELRMILVDPKMVELIVYNNIPHLLSPVVTELERVVPTLKWATREMERRYKIFARLGCRNLEGYLKRTQTRPDLEPMPYIVIVIDELADLMMMAPDDVETQICRLAQMARATGIHLVIATQRPSVDVITGLIKANFPSRVAFAVSSQVDSRVILDTPGAERLLGRGDMLYMAVDSARLVRMQGTYVSDREVERIVDFWHRATPPEHRASGKPQSTGSKSQPAGDSKRQTASDNAQTAGREQADHPAEQAATSGPQPGADTAFTPPAAFLSNDEQEELLPQAVDLVRQHRRASASLLQRRLRIGYSKAAQLIDLLEEQGVVGPAEDGRSREVLSG
jgi:S-DNA-T family DNA segregation ATPase FtsK/SpoIIIE